MKAISFEFGLPEVKDLPETSLVFLSEEHGHLRNADGALRVGQRLALIPSHSDTTINLHDRMYGLRGERIETVFSIEGRGKFQ